MNDQPAVGHSVGAEADSDQWLQWPCCPECGQRRQTFCRTCDLAGDDFGLAEYIPSSDPIGVPAAENEAENGQPDSTHGCRGGSSCSPARAESGDGERAEMPRGGCDTSQVPDPADEQETLPILLFCPDCSEAFSPSYFRLCARCGHDFGEGREIRGPRQSEMNNRVLVAILVLAGLAIGLLVYFWMLFR